MSGIITQAGMFGVAGLPATNPLTDGLTETDNFPVGVVDDSSISNGDSVVYSCALRIPASPSGLISKWAMAIRVPTLGSDQAGNS